jgi:hypothetical protein
MMNKLSKVALFLVLAAAAAARAVSGANVGGHSVSVLVDSVERPKFAARGNLYIEALRGRDFSLRLSNPTGYRVAVALSVDGLNTIDARHTSAWKAKKWVIDPYGSIEIPGWQVDGETSRRFYFTGERQSYGAKLLKTEDLGVIEAVFYREHAPIAPPPIPVYAPPEPMSGGTINEESRRDSAERKSAQAPPASSGALTGPRPQLSDELAATGMGQRTSNPVYDVDLRLERTPVASVRLRYEFRPELVSLGVLPREYFPLDRREHARGFAGYCPEPDGR